MSDTYTGGSAFPSPEDSKRDSGMTLRDYFAAQAMQSLVLGAYTNPMISAAPDGGKITEDVIATQAYYFADSMLKARES